MSRSYRWPGLLGLLVVGLCLVGVSQQQQPTRTPAPATAPAWRPLPGSPLAALGRIPAFAGATYRELGPLHPQGELQRLPYAAMDDRKPPRRFDFLDDADAFSRLTISPNGNHLAMDVLPRLGVYDQLVVVDLTTGVAKTIPLTSDHKCTPGSYDWDPRDPAYLLVNVNSEVDNETSRGRIWRMRYDGTAQTPLTPDTEDISARITPNGDWWIASTEPPPEELVHDGQREFLQARDDPTQRKAIDWPWEFVTLSPDNRYVTRDENGLDPYEIYERATGKRVALLSRRNMAIGSYDWERINFIDGYSSNSGAYWLPDSSGVLLPITVPLSDETSEYQLWVLTLEGEAYRLTRNWRLIANSANGCHWLWALNHKYYLVSVPEKKDK